MTYLDRRNKIILETTDRRSNAKKWTNPRMYSRNVEVELFLSPLSVVTAYTVSK